MCPPDKCCCCGLEVGVKQTAIVWIIGNIISIGTAVLGLLFLSPICDGDGENMGMSWFTEPLVACTYTCCEGEARPWDNVPFWEQDVNRYSTEATMDGCSNQWCLSPDLEGGSDCCAHKDWLEKKTCSTGTPATTNKNLLEICQHNDTNVVITLVGALFIVAVTIILVIAVCNVLPTHRANLGKLWKVHALLVAVYTIGGVARPFVTARPFTDTIGVVFWAGLSLWWTAAARALSMQQEPVGGTDAPVAVPVQGIVIQPIVTVPQKAVP